jgi:CRP-like cAMP-binding protein
MDTLAEILERHPVFASLNGTTRNILEKQAIPKDLQKGEALADQGDIWPYLFLVAEGEVDALKVSSEGRNLLVTTFTAGDLFWGLAFFQDNAPLLATLEAHSAVRVYQWSRLQVEPVFFANGKMGWELCRLMIQRMQRASTIIEELAFQPVAGRLARLLLDQIPQGQQSTARHLTLDEMAARVGTTREMVCRALYRFADRKLINVTRTEFILTDRDGLAILADTI